MKILVVEDDPQLREAILDSLMIRKVETQAAANGQQALETLKTFMPDLVLSDINMPEMDGLTLLAAVRERHPWLPVTLMTAFGDVSQAVQAMQRGANDYLMKPFDLAELDALIATYGNRALPEKKQQPVCQSQASKQLFGLAERVAQTDSTVLISGESGTGKEVLARYIHEHSARSNKPFVAINCAAIPENMLEAMLFGYEKGAFTGAQTAMPGKFEQAQGGTLLLDEVTEMEAGLQAKLLRVLQERQVERLGSKKTLQLDVRILATTNRELAEYVAEGQFREDLYYRLSVFPLQWLPLRERPEDLVPLANRLLAHHAGKMKRPAPRITAEAEKKLRAHSWPGNVRELDNCMQRALIVQAGARIFANDLIMTPIPRLNRTQASGPASASPSSQGQIPPQSVAQDSPSWMPAGVASGSELGVPPSQGGAADNMNVESNANLDDGRLGHDLRHREAELIASALREEPSRKDAADRLGISPRTLRYKMAKFREEGVDIEAMI